MSGVGPLRFFFQNRYTGTETRGDHDDHKKTLATWWRHNVTSGLRWPFNGEMMQQRAGDIKHSLSSYDSGWFGQIWCALEGGRSGKGAAGDFKMASSFSLSGSHDVLIVNEASPNLQCWGRMNTSATQELQVFCQRPLTLYTGEVC